MSDPCNPLQAAIYAALAADAAVLAATGGSVRIYDKLPDPVPYPHVRIGELEANDDSTTCESAWDCFHTIHIFSRANAPRAECNAIAGAIRAELVETPPAPTGFKITESQFASYRSYFERDGVTAHGVLVLRYQVDPA